MSKVDWSKAPEGAEFYALGSFFKRSDYRTMHYANNAEEWLQSGYSVAAIKAFEDYQPRPQQQPKSSVDWSKAPEGATHVGGSLFWKYGEIWYNWHSDNVGWVMTNKTPLAFSDYQPRPQQWPETDERIDNIGRNRTEDDMGHYNAPERTTSDELRQPVSAADFLSEGLKTLSERARQYDPNGKKELSFNQVAEAFNAVTGKAITGADVCLMLVMLKIVRQNATEGFHLDSAVDGVNYMALYAEMLATGTTTN